MSDDIITLWLLLLLTAICVSIAIAFDLERRLKARLPHTRPYKWGFYVGCMGVTCAPLGLLSLAIVAIAKTSEQALGRLVLAGWFLVHAVCGYFIIKRKGWAWIVSTILSFNCACWIINGIYASRRWTEFAEERLGSSSTATPHSWAVAPAVLPPLPAGPSANAMFFLAVRGERQGPYTLGQLRTMWSSGQVPADAHYWQTGMSTWYPLIELLEPKDA